MTANPPSMTTPPIALTIAGFDPSSGAGATADLQVFSAHGLFGTAGLTALTVQSTRGVWRVEPVDPGWLSETLRRLEEDLPPVGIKLGMLGTASIVAVVADYLEEVRRGRSVTVVLDPVLRSSSGAPLLEPKGLGLLRERMLPLIDCVTPNHAELAALLGISLLERGELGDRARELQKLVGGAEVVVTGGDGAEADDLIVMGEGGEQWLRAKRIETRATHGTGCAFASALLCHKIKGHELSEAASTAKSYVRGAIEFAAPLGDGNGPLNYHWARRHTGAVPA